jgi:hypothetical protein
MVAGGVGHRWNAVGAGSTGHVTTAIVAVGAVVWAVGEWIQHPFWQFRRDGHVGSRYRRVWNPLEVTFDLIGITLVVWAIYRFWKLDGSLL